MSFSKLLVVPRSRFSNVHLVIMHMKTNPPALVKHIRFRSMTKVVSVWFSACVFMQLITQKFNIILKLKLLSCFCKRNQVFEHTVEHFVLFRYKTTISMRVKCIWTDILRIFNTNLPVFKFKLIFDFSLKNNSSLRKSLVFIT